MKSNQYNQYQGAVPAVSQYAVCLAGYPPLTTRERSLTRGGGLELLYRGALNEIGHSEGGYAEYVSDERVGG